MNVVKHLQESLTTIIKEKELSKVTSGIIEAVLDFNSENGLLKQVPVLSTLLGLTSATNSIKDKLLAKKILYFLKELSSVPQDQRIEQIIKIEDDNKYRTKVGEKILYVIDQCDDIDKAELAGRLFKTFLEKKIDYDEFLQCISCIERTNLPDLLSFIQGDWDSIGTDYGGSQFVSYGLMEIRVSEPKLERKENPDAYVEGSYLYKLTDFSIKCYVSSEGETIRKYLR